MFAVCWEYFFCVIDAFIFDVFMNAFFYRKKSTKIIRFLLLFLVSSGIFLCTYFVIFSYLSTIAIVFVYFLYSMLAYNSSKMHLFNYSLFFTFLYNMIASMQVMGITILLNINVTEIFSYSSAYRIIFILVSRSMIYVLLQFVIHHYPVEKGLILFEKNFFYFISSGFGFGCVLLSILFQNWTLTKLDFIILSICFVTVVCFVFNIFRSLLVEKIKNENSNMTNDFINAQKIYYENTNKNNENIKILKHDLRNNLQIIDSLLAENQFNQAKNYVNALQGDRSLAKSINCGNFVIDTLINTRIQLNTEIYFDCKIQILDCPIESTVLCAIVSNLLDNAIEATLKCKGHRTIGFRVKESSKVIKITVKNKFDVVPMSKKHILISQKHDSDKHGLGLLSVELAVKKYNGTYTPLIHYDEKEFEAIAILFKKPTQKEVIE